MRGGGDASPVGTMPWWREVSRILVCSCRQSGLLQIGIIPDAAIFHRGAARKAIVGLDLWITERNISHHKQQLLTESDEGKRQEFTEHLTEARKMKALLE
jgi:hypothetical protein